MQYAKWAVQEIKSTCFTEKKRGTHLNKNNFA